MIRRTVTVFALLVAGLIAAAQFAWAQDYAPGTASNVPATTTGALPVDPGGSAASLSYTGAGFNVGGTIAIAAAVLGVGVVLCVLGARLTRTAKH